MNRIKGTVFLTTGRTVGAISQMILLFALATRVNAESYGVTVSLMSLTGFLAALLDWGMPTALFNSSINGKYDVVARVQSVSFTVNLPLLFIALISGLATSISSNNQVWSSVCFISAWAISEKLYEYRNLLQISQNKVMEASFQIAGRRVAALMLFLVFSSIKGADVVTVFLLSLLMPSLSALGWKGLKTKIPMAKPREILACYRASTGYAMSSASGLLRNSDVGVVGALGGPDLAATYSLPNRIFSQLLLVGASIANVGVSNRAFSTLKSARMLVSIGLSVTALLAGASYLLSELTQPLVRDAVTWWPLETSLAVAFFTLKFGLISVSSVLSAQLDYFGAGLKAGCANLIFTFCSLVSLGLTALATDNMVFLNIGFVVICFLQLGYLYRLLKAKLTLVEIG